LLDLVHHEVNIAVVRASKRRKRALSNRQERNCPTDRQNWIEQPNPTGFLETSSEFV
jgi:hypothetical protein